MDGGKGIACVTGGTGFLASWLIKVLLEEGYAVNTTVRPDPEHKRDVSFLTNLPGASEKLKIFEADLNDPDSFDEAIKGCTGVFHVATPIDFFNAEPEPVVTKRAIEGTLGILRACLNSKTVKRVVYTSSAATVVFNESSVDVMDESFWTDLDYVKARGVGGSYFISKTLTEKKSLEFAEEHGLDLVSLIPTYIVGPFICPKLAGSIHVALAMVLGEPDHFGALLDASMVHTDDLARAHIFLLEYPDAKGRYICSSDRIAIEDLAKFLSAKYSEYPIPTVESLKDVKGHKSSGVTSKKLLDSGFRFKHGLDEMFDDAIQCCKEKGFL